MDDPNSKSERPQNQRRFDPKLLKKGLYCDRWQRKFLKLCSEKGEDGIKRWNRWRLKHPKKEIFLEGANFTRAHLKGAYLKVGPVSDETGNVQKLSGKVHLQKTNFSLAHLEGSSFHEALLQNAILKNAHLEDVALWSADLRGTDVTAAAVSVFTSFWKCKVSRYRKGGPNTNFEGVALGSVRVDPATKQLLEYNIRRKNWEEWYPKQNWLLAWFVRQFWRMSDYGISTKRIISTFFGLALFFAAIYSNMALWFPPGIVSYLEVEPHLPLWHYFILLLLRPIYFSVVTMTTLGFGDMYAYAQSIWGHILLTIQVILGYVLLGALVTRFAVLFTAGGPAGKFADDKEREDKEK